MVDNTAGFTEPLVANDNNSHCDEELVQFDNVNTHEESSSSLTPTMTSTVSSYTVMKDEVVDDVSTVPRNVCSTASVVRPRLSLNTQQHSSDLNLALVLVCTFLVFILTYLFFCFVLSLTGLRVIAKFATELD